MTEDQFAAIAADIFDPVMADHDIPGLAVAVTMDGEHFIHTAGQSDPQAGKATAPDTLFELGSISKVLNVTLTALAAEQGKLTLDDPVSAHIPELESTAFGQLRLIDLATHQTGGLPLQVPDEVSDDEELIAWLADWQPANDPQMTRSYSNISIGLLGKIAGAAFGQTYSDATAQHLLPKLGMNDTYIAVPQHAADRYAWGYSRDGDGPIRVNPGVLDDEAYGFKSTPSDMLHLLDASLDETGPMAQVFAETHAGRASVAYFDQAMIWERYPWPVDPAQLQDGNDTPMVLESQQTRIMDHPDTHRDGLLLSKTGSTNGFAGYVALIPEHDFGMVVLANRNYPSPARVLAGQALAQRLLETVAR